MVSGDLVEFIQSTLAFVVTLGVLVTIHEWGHFYVARLCGVKVLRFSVGFGKVLFSRSDRSGTEFALAAIPLGGYVKMLDEREGEVSPELKSQTFNQKNVWQRIAIVIAGPAVNLIFAVFAYWFLFIYGVTTVAPVIGATSSGSIAAMADLPTGYEIASVDGVATPSWQEVNLALARRIGDSGAIKFTLVDPVNQKPVNDAGYSLAIDKWNLDLESTSPVSAIGLMPFRPEIAPVLGQILPQGRAELAGLQVGDKIIAVNGQDVVTWAALVGVIQTSAEIELDFKVQRAGQFVDINVTPAEKVNVSGRITGVIGAGVQAPVWPASMLNTQKLGLIDGLYAGSVKTWQMISLTLDSIVKMVEGIISVKNLSGPITIAKVASASAASGLESYISFLAYLSISLGVLNLLPIPMLDGGHLLFYIVEAARGKPVPQKLQDVGLRLGMLLLFSMMAIAVFNDFMRL